MFGSDRNQLRRIYFDSWQLKLEGKPLDAMQTEICRVISQHPEYHSLLSDISSLEQDFSVESGKSNPFLHMSMHIALHEQLSTNRPAGIRLLYQQLCQQYSSVHDTEHAMMECLGEAIWLAQRNQCTPDETAYLNSLRKLIVKK